MKYPIQKLKKFRFLRRSSPRSPRRPIPRIVVPSFFTLMNLFCGFVSLILVAEGNLILGAWLIALAGLFDALDGVMARLANATSEFGIELDSICDVVSFGVAPGFLIYHYGLNELALFGIILSTLPPLCGAVRLARFNVDTKYGGFEDFRGLPIPVQAIMLAAFVLTFISSPELFEDMQFGVATVLIPIVILLSFLMVSTIPFDKLPRFDRQSFKNKKGKFVQFLIYLGLIIIFQEYGLMFVFSVYILKGLLMGGWYLWNNGVPDDDLSYKRNVEGNEPREEL
ncbi:MAG: CDP-diacylglycerol--serine O-phosphatidyltransferase [Balneolaceae bacterium]